MAQSRLIGACAMAALMFGTVACGDRYGSSESTPAENTVGTAGEDYAAGTTPVADIVSEPNSYFGREVTVVADVEEVFGPYAFALDEDAPLRGGIDRDMLVLTRKSTNLADIDDQWLMNKVRVTGTIGRISVVEIEREIGWDLDPELEVELEGAGAVLIAQSVERVEDAAGTTGGRQ